MLVAAGPGLAQAQPAQVTCQDYVPPEARRDATALTMRGVACFEEEEFGRALHYYRRAYTLSQDPLLEAAIGRSLDELGLWSAAQAYYERYLRNASSDPEGRARIQERLEELDQRQRERAAKLTVTAQPLRVSVTLETPQGQLEELGQTPLMLKLAPGDYTLILERPGFYGRRVPITLTAQQERTESVELVPQGATFNLASRRIRRVGAITMLAAGPTLVGGAALTLASEERRGLGYGLMLVGAAGLISGGVISAIGYRRDHEDPEPSLAAPTPMVGPSQVGLRWRW